nr:amidase family protein [Neobacillus sp. Marseille-Q6967]
MQLSMKKKMLKVTNVLATLSLAGTLAFTSSSSAEAKSTKKPFNIEEATISDMQKALQTGEITSVELTQMYIDRINKYDKNGVKLNSVLEINPDALDIAEELDENRKGKGNAGPLYGIPIIVKDNIDTADNMHTSAGSIALANNIAKQDSFVAKKLREAGAIIIGKANMTEWANYMTNGMPGGYSSRGGQVLNPYGRGVLGTGGSSAGTGSAIGANLAAAGIGTETSGSILSPSYRQSLVGIKPTVGLISRSGIIPIAHSQDTAGPMTRTVTDSAILLGALTGVDEKDPVTKTSIGQVPKDYTKFLKKDGLKGARIGIDKNYLRNVSPEELVVFNEAVEDMKKQGAIIIDTAEIPSRVELNQHNSIVLSHEFKGDLNAYLESLSDEVPVHSLEELIAFNSAHEEQALAYGQARLIEAQGRTGDLNDPEYLEDRRIDLELSRTKGIDAVMAQYDLDALLFANSTGAGIAAKAGYPSVTVPAGYAEGTGQPVGVTFTGKAFSEPELIKLAYSYEQATKKRVAPVLE